MIINGFGDDVVYSNIHYYLNYESELLNQHGGRRSETLIIKVALGEGDRQKKSP